MMTDSTSPGPLTIYPDSYVKTKIVKILLLACIGIVLYCLPFGTEFSSDMAGDGPDDHQDSKRQLSDDSERNCFLDVTV